MSKTKTRATLNYTKIQDDRFGCGGLGFSLNVINQKLPPLLLEHMKKFGNRSKQGWEAVERTWTRDNISMPFTISRFCLTGWLYVSASSWQDPPTGPTNYSYI